MKKTFTLSVHTPCSEKWNNFSPVSGGGFCSSCSKVVVDFTEMNETSIVNYFKSSPSHTCGRFRADQLKRYDVVHPTNVRPGVVLLRASLAALFVILLSRPSYAQTNITKVKTEQVQQQIVIADAGKNTVASYVLRGQVKSAEDSLAYPGVNVLLKNSNVGMATDENGRFELQDLKGGDVVVFSFIGLASQEYIVPTVTPGEIVIYLRADVTGLADYVLMGEVAGDGLYSEPSRIRKFWTKLKRIF